MIKVDYFMSHGSPWTFLGHYRINNIVKKFDVQINMYPVNYGEIFPVSGGLPVFKRPLQRQKIRLQELKRWAELLRKIKFYMVNAPQAVYRHCKILRLKIFQLFFLS